MASIDFPHDFSGYHFQDISFFSLIVSSSECEESKMCMPGRQNIVMRLKERTVTAAVMVTVAFHLYVFCYHGYGTLDLL